MNILLPRKSDGKIGKKNPYHLISPRLSWGKTTCHADALPVRNPPWCALHYSEDVRQRVNTEMAGAGEEEREVHRGHTFGHPSEEEAGEDEGGSAGADHNVYKVMYHSFNDFNNKAKLFGIFAEWKDGVPRGGYRWGARGWKRGWGVEPE